MDYAQYEQELVTNFFGWTTLGVCLLGLLWLVITSAGYTAVDNISQKSVDKDDPKYFAFEKIHNMTEKLKATIEKTQELHPEISKESIILGENTNRYLDQGTIIGKNRDYFFPISTPPIETAKECGVSTHINENISIKISGTVDNYIIEISEKLYPKNLVSVYSSQKKNFDDRVTSLDN